MRYARHRTAQQRLRSRKSLNRNSPAGPSGWRYGVRWELGDRSFERWWATLWSRARVTTPRHLNGSIMNARPTPNALLPAARKTVIEASSPSGRVHQPKHPML